MVKPDSPKVSPQTEMAPVILVVEDTEADPELAGGWELILYNDEVNSRHHVGGWVFVGLDGSDGASGLRASEG